MTEAAGDDRLRERGLAALRQHVPAVHRTIAGLTPRTGLRTTAGGPDLYLGKTGLYGGEGAQAFAARQVASYLAAPHILTQNRPETATLDPHSAATVEVLRQRAEAEGLIPVATTPVLPDTTFLFVVGIGLGAHLDRLVEATRPRILVLVEPEPDFLYQSTAVHDWEGFIARCQRDGVILQFVTAPTPEQAAQDMRAVLRLMAPSGIDGSLLYQHLPGSRYDTIVRLFAGQYVHTGLSGIGFFEDERHMLAQTWANLRQGARMLTPPRRSPTLPAIVVANGPSLDASAEVLHELQDRAVIIGCGTTYRPLLTYGIRPDFLVVLERGPEHAAYCHDVAGAFDTSGICLIASTTVVPETREAFDHALFFFRPWLSSHPAFCRDPRQTLELSGPMAGNAGLAAALWMGFPEIYLFGLDMGARDPGYHHSRHRWVPVDTLRSMDFRHRLRGNFGGEVWADDDFLTSRETAGDAIARFAGRRRVINCSNGARIEGALPRKPGSLRLPIPRESKATVVDRLIADSPEYTPRMAAESWHRHRLDERLPGYLEHLRAAADAGGPVRDMIVRLSPLLRFDVTGDALPMLVRGTLALTLGALNHDANRLPPGAKRDRFAALAREALLDLIDRLNHEARTVLSNIAAPRGGDRP